MTLEKKKTSNGYRLQGDFKGAKVETGIPGRLTAGGTVRGAEKFEKV